MAHPAPILSPCPRPTILRGLGGVLALALLTVATPRACGTELPVAVRGFLEQHCISCHRPQLKSGRLDLTALAFDPQEQANFAMWARIHDRVQLGEMPPADRVRPPAAAIEASLAPLAATLMATERAWLAAEGRAVQRRLNRYEYENALRDLLGVPWAQIMNRLPEDGLAHGYNKSGEALDISFVQMSRFMSSADYALRQALTARLERPPSTTRRFYARDEPTLRGQFRPRENGTLPDRLAMPVLDSRAQPEVRAGLAPISNPATREREAIGKVSSIFSDAGGYSWSQFRAPVAGRYRVRIAGYTIWVGGGGVARWFYEGQGAEKAPIYHTLLWHRPNLDEVWPGRRNEPIGVYASGSGQTRPVGAVDFTPQPTVSEIEVSLLANETIQTDAMRFFRTRVNGTDEQYVNPLAEPDGMPGYAVQWIEVQGPLPDPDADAGYRLLFGDLPLRRADGGQGVAIDSPPGQAPAAGGPAGRGGRGPGRGGALREITVEVVSADPRQDAERLLRAFVQRAYRRPVEDAEIRRFLALFEGQFARGQGFTRSMITAYTAVLSSPGFVFLQEKPGRLDDYALATRLSLLLWNSEPDPTLRELAARGELSRPGVLRAQAERLLADPKSRRFVDAFTDYWLDLRKIEDTSPSTTLYNDYELDDPLKQAAVEETRLFVAELLRQDLPARNIVASDFTFLNERLANHYGVPGVQGAQMRRVTLPPDSLRGGLLTQASVLKVSANGTTTSPVLRGHWITQRILGIEIPPPPPTVEAVEPDIRGAVTIRQQLDMHRSNPSCASCHTKMDPPGFALEAFDVMGGLRERYRAVAEDVTPIKGFGMNGQAFAFHYALPVDSAGTLPDGRAFRDVREFKQLLVQDEAAIARNLARQLAIYATWAPVRFSDRPQIDAILERTRAGGYGVRSLVLAIVESEMFRNK